MACPCRTTVIGTRMSHRKWREIKQQLIRWPDLALLGCCLVSLHFKCDILAPITVDGSTMRVWPAPNAASIQWSAKEPKWKNQKNRLRDLAADLRHHCVCTEMAKQVCPRLREIARAARGGITQPRTHFFGHPCMYSVVKFLGWMRE